eukprot:14309993-Heterocapsa_arctica.AAC.1
MLREPFSWRTAARVSQVSKRSARAADRPGLLYSDAASDCPGLRYSEKGLVLGLEPVLVLGLEPAL